MLIFFVFFFNACGLSNFRQNGHVVTFGGSDRSEGRDRRDGELKLSKPVDGFRNSC